MRKIPIILIIFTILFAGQPVAANNKSGLEQEIIYNILVDRFNIGNPKASDQVDIQDYFAYHGGDIVGITKKLDHFVEHRFSTISISPIMKNADKGYHGYWIEDFYGVEEQLGSMEDVKELVKEAHEKEIRVVLELVTNYVAKSHPFVNDASKADWFKENTTPVTEATSWLNDVVMLDQENPEVQAYLLDVAEFWLTETGADGFKLHAADQSSPAFLEKLTEKIYEVNAGAYVLAGVIDKTADLTALEAIEGIMAIDNTALFDTIVETFADVEQPVENIYQKWLESGSRSDLLFVDDQTTKRFTNEFLEHGRNKVTAWKLALTYLYTTPGMPSIYQGSEMAMTGGDFPENQYLVLFNHNDKNLTEYIEKIASLRNSFPVLQHGDFELLDSNGSMSLFKRTYEGQVMYLAINNDSVSRSVTLTDLDPELQLRGVLGDNTVRANDDGEFVVGIERESVEAYIIEENKGFNWWFISFVVGVFLIFIISVNILMYKQRKRNAQAK